MRTSIPILAICALVILFSLAALPTAVPAQDNPASAAPVAWERYRAAHRTESVLLPKLPTARQQTAWCSDLRTDSYFAYAEDLVYEFSIAYKDDLGNYLNCTPKRFNQAMFDDRLKELRTNPKNIESAVSKNGRAGFEFAGDLESRWLFPDIKNNRWIELTVHHRPGVKVDGAKLTDSLDLSGGQGKDIGEGSPVTLGDVGIDSSVMSPPQRMQDPVLPNNQNFQIISKPKAVYTDQARKNNIRGSVQLKVVFLASGGIGTVTLNGKGLEDGLTEQAMAAAKRVVFLPKKVNGVPVSTTATFEYGFSIY